MTSSTLLTVTDEHILKHRKLFNQYFDDIDPLSLPLMALLNSIPGVGTEMCCDGHVGNEQPWFTLLVTKDGTDNWEQIYDAVWGTYPAPNALVFFNYSWVTLEAQHVEGSPVVRKIKVELRSPELYTPSMAGLLNTDPDEIRKEIIDHYTTLMRFGLRSVFGERYASLVGD